MSQSARRREKAAPLSGNAAKVNHSAFIWYAAEPTGVKLRGRRLEEGSL